MAGVCDWCGHHTDDATAVTGWHAEDGEVVFVRCRNRVLCVTRRAALAERHRAASAAAA